MKGKRYQKVGRKIVDRENIVLESVQNLILGEKRYGNMERGICWYNSKSTLPSVQISDKRSPFLASAV